MIEERTFSSEGGNILSRSHIALNSRDSKEVRDFFNIKYDTNLSLFELIYEDKIKKIYRSYSDSIKKVCYRDMSPFLQYLDFFKKYSNGQNDTKTVKSCVEVMQYFFPIPLEVQQIKRGGAEFEVKSYEYYKDKYSINNKKIHPIKIQSKQKQAQLYGELYDRFYSLFPENILAITSIPKESIEFMQSPNKIPFAFCTDLNPLYLTTQSAIQSRGVYDCHHRYNDKKLVESYPELATNVGFINGVRDVLCGKTYYDMFHDQLVNHELMYKSLLGKKIIENLDYCDEKGISDISYELNQIQVYYQENKNKINYSEFGQFLETLYNSQK